MKNKDFGIYLVIIGMFILAGTYFGIVGVAVYLLILGIVTIILGGNS